jgi:hypothetical protein
MGLPPIPANQAIQMQMQQLPNLAANGAIPNINELNGRGPEVRVREINIHLRPVLIPLFMLLFRILLLVYFFRPSRTPLVLIPLLLFTAWEIWRALGNPRRPGVNANGDGNGQPRVENQNQGPAAVNNAGAGNGNGPVNNDRPAPGAVNQGGAAQGANGGIENQAAAGVRVDIAGGNPLDTLANFNMDGEDRILNGQPDGRELEEPTFSQKAMVFGTLLLSTMYPAVWDKRRANLRRREGPIRAEARVRGADEESGEDAEATQRAQRRAELVERHRLRPRWVQEYMERVVEADWVDEAD